MLKRLKNSWKSRVIIPWEATHFEKTAYGKRLRAYKGKYQGKRCFLIGNGPSLRADDLTKLYAEGEITFGFNRIYNIFEDTPWRPTFYISQDEKMLQGCADIVDSLNIPEKFIPIRLMWWHNISIKNACWFMLIPPREEHFKPLDFSDAIEHCMYDSSTCMYTAAQLAAYMGFTEIYLLGVDHQFRTSINNKGEIITDSSVRDYFSDRYNEDKEQLYIPNTEKSTFT